jgi:hypothetical protein
VGQLNDANPGTNDVHGSLYVRRRMNWLNANSYFSSATFWQAYSRSGWSEGAKYPGGEQRESLYFP